MPDDTLSTAQRLRIVADSIELAECYGFLDNNLRTEAAQSLRAIAVELQQPLIDAAVEQLIAEEPVSRRERKVLHRLRAKLALVGKQSSTEMPEA